MRFQVYRRGNEIPLAVGNGIGVDPAVEVHPADDRGVRRLARAREKAQVGLAGNLRAARAVGKADAVVSFTVLKIKINALLLAQPGDEMEVGLAVLDAVFTLLVFAVELEGIGLAGVTLLVEDLLDDLDY